MLVWIVESARGGIRSSCEAVVNDSKVHLLFLRNDASVHRVIGIVKALVAFWSLSNSTLIVTFALLLTSVYSEDMRVELLLWSYNLVSWSIWDALPPHVSINLMAL